MPLRDAVMERHYARPRIVVSRCIEFDPCRYDGSGVPSPLVARLRSHADCLPVCPEVEIGLGIPRATVRLVRQDGADRLVQPATGRDFTDEMTAFAGRFLDVLPPVDGFILKGGSPTSGASGVRVYPSAGKSNDLARFGALRFLLAVFGLLLPHLRFLLGALLWARLGLLALAARVVGITPVSARTGLGFGLRIGRAGIRFFNRIA